MKVAELKRILEDAGEEAEVVLKARIGDTPLELRVLANSADYEGPDDLGFDYFELSGAITIAELAQVAESTGLLELPVEDVEPSC